MNSPFSTLARRLSLFAFFFLLASNGLAQPATLLSNRIDSVVQRAIQDGEIPGAVVLVAKDGKILHRNAYGYAQLYDYGMRKLAQPEPMTPEHLFDLASMTKVLATTMGMMVLVDRGAVKLNDPVFRYLPEFRGPSKDSITVRHLLTHSSGLYQWQPLYLYASTKTEVFKQICAMPLQYPVGAARRYSDLGFMLLGYIIEKTSGMTLDEFVKREIYRPLNLRSTSYTPLAFGFTKIAATSHGNPYEYRMVADTAFGYRVIGDPSPEIFKGWRHYTLKGETNDGNAFYGHGGVAGHAGLFSTVDDVYVLLSVMLNKGEYGGKRIFRPQVVEEFTKKNEYGHGLGWQVTNLSPNTSEEIVAIGHSGFTGTYGAFIPSHRAVLVILTNRQNLDVKADGFYNDIRNLQRDVTAALMEYFTR